MRLSVVAVAAVAAAVVGNAAPADAAICESFGEDVCEGTAASGTYCTWTERGCTAGEPLEEGFVSITSIGVVDEEPPSREPLDGKPTKSAGKKRGKKAAKKIAKALRTKKAKNKAKKMDKKKGGRKAAKDMATDLSKKAKKMSKKTKEMLKKMGKKAKAAGGKEAAMMDKKAAKEDKKAAMMDKVKDVANGRLAAGSTCALEMVTGPCRAAFMRWGFDVVTNKCVEFMYGGCGGNKNNFKSEKECAKSCSSQV